MYVFKALYTTFIWENYWEIIFIILRKLLRYNIFGSLVLVSLAQLVKTMHKNMQGPGFKPRPPPRKYLVV